MKRWDRFVCLEVTGVFGFLFFSRGYRRRGLLRGVEKKNEAGVEQSRLSRSVHTGAGPHGFARCGICSWGDAEAFGFCTVSDRQESI